MTMIAALQEDRQVGVSKTFLDSGLPLCRPKGVIAQADSYKLIKHVVRSYAMIQMTTPSVVGEKDAYQCRALPTSYSRMLQITKTGAVSRYNRYVRE